MSSQSDLENTSSESDFEDVMSDIIDPGYDDPECDPYRSDYNISKF